MDEFKDLLEEDIPTVKNSTNLLDSIMSVEEFDETHKSWQLYKDPGQVEFYTKVNFD